MDDVRGNILQESYGITSFAVISIKNKKKVSFESSGNQKEDEAHHYFGY